ncbi:MFS transporter [Streptacidiphilus sp. N1-12]|uniref:MFS transporter n=2 Tax=Streptacidiphilus alkalitolerans TaxID=3342712 RepID=A0ABV6WL06_9ACTN
MRCHSGYNRSGLVVAQTLIELGQDPLAAIALVRQKRSPWALNNQISSFLWWTCLRAVFHRGYVLASGIYFVVDARLSPSQIIGLGIVMAATLTLSDIPAGAWSDTFSRKWPLVAGHGFLAAGMVLTGLVTAYPLVLCTQVLWALGWAFSGGADVAWLTEELGRPNRVARVLAARARWELIGGAVGMIVFGLLGWAVGLSAAIVASGAAMALLGLFVASRFPEDNFHPVHGHRLAASLSVLRRGIALARQDREILLMLAATMAVSGAEVISWLFARRLVSLGLSGNPVVSYAIVGLLSTVAGVIALRLVEARIAVASSARSAYAAGCLAAAVGLALLVLAPNAVVGGIGLLLASGVGFSITRAVSVIWVNRRATSDIRATIHSLLSQAETTGEVAGGLLLALTAQAAGMSAAFTGSGVLIACVGVLIATMRPRVGTVAAVHVPVQPQPQPPEHTAYAE